MAMPCVQMAQYYELVVYTDQLPTYADPILDRLDPQRFIQYRLYRDSTQYINGKHVSHSPLVKEASLLTATPACMPAAHMPQPCKEEGIAANPSCPSYGPLPDLAGEESQLPQQRSGEGAAHHSQPRRPCTATRQCSQGLPSPCVACRELCSMACTAACHVSHHAVPVSCGVHHISARRARGPMASSLCLHSRVGPKIPGQVHPHDSCPFVLVC